MKPFMRIFILLILLSSFINYAQEFNGYKYFIVSDLLNQKEEYIEDNYQISKLISDYFTKKNITVINGLEADKPRELEYNPCLGLIVKVHFYYYEYMTLDFYNYKNEKIKHIYSKKCCSNGLSIFFKELDNNPSYSYDEKISLCFEYPNVENHNKGEIELKAYFETNKIDPIEGIYKSYQSNSYYKLGVIKDGNFYKALVIESDYLHWKKGDVKAIFESTAAEDVFSTKYFKDDKTSIETFANLEGGLFTIEMKGKKGENEDLKLLRIYPKK
jgi:hypothetical protein